MEAGNHDSRREMGMVSFDDGSTCSYRIIKSDRRTLALQVTKTGEVFVRIPRRLAFGAGHELVQKNRDWVFAQVAKVRKAGEQREAFHWTEGASLLLYGHSRVLLVKPDHKRKTLLCTGHKGESGGFLPGGTH